MSTENIISLTVGVLTIAATIVVVFIAGNQWKKQKQKELTISVNQNLHTKKLAALTAVWSLLRFLTDKDNGDNIYIKDKQDNYKQTFQSLKHSNQFYEAIKDVFYNQGHGLYINQYYPNIREQLFKCRMHYKRFEDKNSTVIKSDLLPVDDKGVKIAKANYNTLNKQLKKAIKDFEQTPNWI